MKRHLIIIFVFIVLAGTSFTMMQNSKKPTDFCCKRKGFKEKQDTKKPVAPNLYLPVVNFF